MQTTNRKIKSKKRITKTINIKVITNMKIEKYREAENTYGQKHMLGPKTKTHAWANAGNTCLAKCWKHMLGQMLEIYGLAQTHI